MTITRSLGKAGRRAARVLWPDQRFRVTREGWGYGLIWIILLAMGLYQQMNLLMLVSGLAAGPIVASAVASTGAFGRLRLSRRAPAYAFSGEPLAVDYTLENGRLFAAALAMNAGEVLVPVDRVVSGAETVSPRAFFARVPGRGRGRARWEGVAPRRGRFRFQGLELITRAPFGLLERRAAVEDPGQIVVYPAVGRPTRGWHMLHREATQTSRGKRHDRTAQQQEYHGLRDYRPDDSPRWIHWRTTARLGRPMIKEFEQQHEQDFALLIDPWMPRGRAATAQREVVEEVIRFAATVCLELCRRPGRRLLLGWTGPTPGVRHGPASVKLLHELLEGLATLRPAAEGHIGGLLDAMPPAVLRESVLLIASTRPVNLAEEIERSKRLSETSGRGLLAGRALILNASRGDLAEYVQFDRAPAHRPPGVADSAEPAPAVGGDGRGPSGAVPTGQVAAHPEGAAP